jgi:hypothetical protein
MKVYLEYLYDLFLKQGGWVIERNLHSLKEIIEPESVDLIINCTGIG